MIDENEQHFIFDVPQTLPVLMIDRERIYQVLLNLIRMPLNSPPGAGKSLMCGGGQE
jgi:nitrogen-specific signal transduction histidine kinase